MINYILQLKYLQLLLGTVIAEMILGEPLFPGENAVEQLVEIIKILGTPSKE